MAKIALAVEEAVARRARQGEAASDVARALAEGDGWNVDDMVCNAGPRDRPFEERHETVSLAVVAAGSFQYRTRTGRALMTPGSLFLGNPGDGFECGHEHGCGDRCVAFHFAPEWFARIAAEAGALPLFGLPRLPPLAATARMVARACAGALGAAVCWEELAVDLAAAAVCEASGRVPRSGKTIPGAVARVTRIVRAIEQAPAERLGLGELAARARLSPYHFLRLFRQITGVTPHQYILRTRLREAAVRLALEPVRVIDIALDAGFGDVSNFNHAFRAEFGCSPRGLRNGG